LQKDALFLGRYRVKDRKRSPKESYYKKITLLVFDEIEHEDLAIEVFITRAIDHPVHQRQFMREAVLLSRKGDMPGLCKTLSFGQTRDFCYQIMELLDGKALGTFLDELKADPENNIGIPEMDVLGMLLNLLVTLDAMHSAGILHTAITPLDIILLKNSFKTVKLLNWRMAKWSVDKLLGHPCPVLEEVPDAGMLRDVQYICPELAESANAKPSTAWDMYSLGCIAFEFVALQPPFVGYTRSHPEYLTQRKIIERNRADRLNYIPLKNCPAWLVEFVRSTNTAQEQKVWRQLVSNGAENVMDAIVREQVQMQPPYLQDSLTSDDFLKILDKLLEKRPTQRYRECTELSEDLKLLLDQLESLPSAMQECLPHLRYRVRGKDGRPESAGSDVLGIADLVQCLDLRQEPRTEFTSRYLAKFATELTVDNLRITGGIIPLAELRDTNRPDLNLRGRNLASHDVLVLSRMLNSVKHIQNCDLSSNVIAYESAYSASTNPRAYDLSGLDTLADALARLPLLSLDLSGNSLGGKGGTLICERIAGCTLLETLRLAFCELMPAGGIVLGQTMKQLKQLQLVDISHCSVGDEGAIAVADAIKQSAALVSISFFGNAMENEGGAAVMKALEYNFNILSLSMGDNTISDVHLRVIQRAINFNNQYSSLKERNDKFDGFGHNLMAESLRTWAKGDRFIAQRLLYRLQNPRDTLEEDVAKLLVTAEGLDLNSQQNAQVAIQA
jgi:serine/threonine protein kinase